MKLHCVIELIREFLSCTFVNICWLLVEDPSKAGKLTETAELPKEGYNFLLAWHPVVFQLS